MSKIEYDKYFVDTSAWLEYFLSAKSEIVAIIDSSQTKLFTSVISLYEVKKKLLKLKFAENEIEEAIFFIKLNSSVILIDTEIALKAASSHLAAIDSLIYQSTIITNSKLITCDNDFQNLSNVIIIQK